MRGKSCIQILKTTLREQLLITNTKRDKLQLGNKNHRDHLLVAWDGTWRSFRFAGRSSKKEKKYFFGLHEGHFIGCFFFFFWVGCLLFQSLLRCTTSIMSRYRLSRGQSMTDRVPMCMFFCAGMLLLHLQCWDHCNLEKWSCSNTFNFTRSPKNHDDT